MVLPWPTIGTRAIGDFRIVKLREDRCVSPRTGAVHDLIVLEAPDWVNVVALTAGQGAVMIRQYRFGTREVTLEIAGGVVDPGEDPAEAAVRELREETGYVSSKWTDLGSIAPNPAIQTNRCHTFLAEDCTLAGEADLQDGEDIDVEVVALDDVKRRIADGRVSHALVLVAFHKLGLLREGLLAPGPRMPRKG